MRTFTLNTQSLTMIILFVVSLAGLLHSTTVGIPALLDKCDVISDANDDLLVWGCYKNDLDFGSVVLTSPEAFSGFVAKLDTSGKWLWVKDFPGAHPYQMMWDGMMIWLENDGCIGVSGPFTWDSPFGKKIADNDCEQMSLAYLSPEGEPLALDDTFLRDRKNPQRPDYDQDMENNRIESMDNGDFRYSAEYDGGPLIICCENLRNNSSWELDFQVIPVLARGSGVNLDRMAALAGGGVAFIGSFWGERLQLGDSRIINRSEDSQVFIGGIKSDGSGAWLRPVESLVDPSYYSVYELFASLDGGVVLSEHPEMENNEFDWWANEHHFRCFDASGNLAWTVNLGKPVGHRGNFNLVEGDDGTHLFSAGYLGSGGFIHEPRILQLDEAGDVVNRFSLPGKQVGMFDAAGFLQNRDLVYCSLTSDNDVYRYTISSLSKDMKKKWENVLICEYLDPMYYCKSFVVVDNSIFLITQFRGAVSWQGKTLATSGQSGMLILRIDSGGNLLYSQKFLSKAKYYSLGINAYVSAKGEVFIYGTDNNNLTTKPTSPVKGQGNGCVCRLGSKGEILWMRRFDQKGNIVLKLIVDGKGNAYLVGSNPPGTFRLGNQTINTPNDSEQLILMILDSKGNCKSLKVLATLADMASIYSCALSFDKHGLLYIAYPESIVNNWTESGSIDWLRLICYDKAGGLLKKASFELADISAVPEVVIADNGNIYVSTHKLDYYSGAGNYHSGYLVALDKDMEMLWSKNLICDFKITTDGSLYFRSYFDFYVDLDEQIITTNVQYADVCLGKISPTGHVEWLKSALLMK